MNKVAFTDQFYLKLQLKPPDFSRTYGVMIIFTTETIETSLKYEVMVSYVKTITETTRIFKIERVSSVYVNDIVPDTTADELAYEVGKVFYPLMIEVGFDGKFQAVHNYKEILGRWPAVKDNVLSYFTGEETGNYLKLMEETLYDESEINECFRNDLFISSYFNSIYKSYTKAYQIEEEMSFPVAVRTRSVEFLTTQRVDQDLNDYDAIEIHHEGILSDERTAVDINNQLDFPLSRMENPDIDTLKGTYKAKYILDQHTKSVEFIIASWHLPGTKTESTEVRIFRIDTQASKESVNAALEGNNLVYLDGNSATKNKTGISGFFESLFGK